MRSPKHRWSKAAATITLFIGGILHPPGSYKAAPAGYAAWAIGAQPRTNPRFARTHSLGINSTKLTICLPEHVARGHSGTAAEYAINRLWAVAEVLCP